MNMIDDLAHDSPCTRLRCGSVDELYSGAATREISQDQETEDATKSKMEIKEMRCNLYTYEEISPGLFPHSGGATTEQT